MRPARFQSRSKVLAQSYTGFSSRIQIVEAVLANARELEGRHYGNPDISAAIFLGRAF